MILKKAITAVLSRFGYEISHKSISINPAISNSHIENHVLAEYELVSQMPGFLDLETYNFFYSPKKLLEILDSRSTSDLIAMGKKAALVWKQDLKYKQWCDYAVKELL